jgi:hypothetical protein
MVKRFLLRAEATLETQLKEKKLLLDQKKSNWVN